MQSRTVLAFDDIDVEAISEDDAEPEQSAHSINTVSANGSTQLLQTTGSGVSMADPQGAV